MNRRTDRGRVIFSYQKVVLIPGLCLALAYLLFSLSACEPSPSTAPTPAPVPTKTPTPVPPTQRAIPTPSLTPSSPPLTYNQAFLEALGTDEESCLPDKTSGFVGVYIYDLDEDRELVSINADTPFQFASAFKGPVLTYFLESCQQIWDPNDPAWETHALETAPGHESNWYQSKEYRQKLADQIYNAGGWGEIETFSFENRPIADAEAGPLDKRYFILHQVYNMVTESNNISAGDVLNYVFDHCLEKEENNEAACGGPNALTRFNAWFNRFAEIETRMNEPQRGLYNWDTLLMQTEEGKLQELEMPTAGQKDSCVTARASLSCVSDQIAVNAYTPRDLFRFYYALYHLPENRIRKTSMDILGVHPSGISRGYLKNMAATLGVRSMSKNGRAAYSGKSIVTDAGILSHGEKSYVIVTLTYNTVEAMEKLYGYYLENGTLVHEENSLIQSLLEGKLRPDND